MRSAMMPRRFPRAGGYTLLEVLVALIVFSIGLLGLAAMLGYAVKGNHKAYYHSQALNVAHDLALLGLGRRVRSLERNHA